MRKTTPAQILAAAAGALILAAFLLWPPPEPELSEIQAAVAELGEDDPRAMLLGVDPETGVKLHEGDILTPPPAAPCPPGQVCPLALGSGRPWPLGYVFYEVDPSYWATSKLEAAIADIEAVSEIHFIPRTDEADYILIKESGGCSAQVGYYGSGVQRVNLSSTSCGQRAVRHELMHALGFQHEHTWVGRDLDIDVHMGCIEAGAAGNFQTHGGPHYCAEGETCGTDFLSTMIYASSSFCDANKAPCPTDNAAGGCFSMTRKDGTHWGIVQPLSAADIVGLNAHYAEEIAKRPEIEPPPAIEPGDPHVLEVHGWELRVWLIDPVSGELQATVATQSRDSGVFEVSWSGWAITVTVLPAGGGWWLGASGSTDLEWRLEGAGPAGEEWLVEKTGREPSPAFIRSIP